MQTSMRWQMPEPHDGGHDRPDERLAGLLREARDSAFRREELFETEKELILEACEALKSYGFSPAEWLLRTPVGRRQKRVLLKLDRAAPPPSVERLDRKSTRLKSS